MVILCIDAEDSGDRARAEAVKRMWRVETGDSQREFMKLLDEHGPVLMATLRRLCGSLHEAEDIFQNVAARVWHGFSERPRLHSPRAWLMKIGYRMFLNARRRPRPQPFVPDRADERQTPALEGIERSELSERVQAAIAGLAEPVREVVILHYVAGLMLRQTAAVMGLTQGTVKSRLHAALKQIRSVME